MSSKKKKKRNEFIFFRAIGANGWTSEQAIANGTGMLAMGYVISMALCWVADAQFRPTNATHIYTLHTYVVEFIFHSNKREMYIFAVRRFCCCFFSIFLRRHIAAQRWELEAEQNVYKL